MNILSVKKKLIIGAAVLSVSNVIVKIFGFLFKIPLANLIGKEGMGYYGVAFQLFSAVFVIVAAGLPIAVTRLTSQRDKTDKTKFDIFSSGFVIFILLGVLGTLLTYFCAGLFVDAVNNKKALICIWMLAPSVLFSAIECAVRSYNQGQNNLYPTAISQIFDSLFRMVFGFGIAYFLKTKGFPVYIAAAGAVLGVTIANVFSAFGLMVYQKISSKKIKFKPNMKISKSIIKIALPITGGAVVLSVFGLLDTLFIMNRLNFAGFTSEQANGLYGAYTGYTLNIFHIPSIFTSSLVVSVFPVIAGQFYSNRTDNIIKTVNSALKLCIVFALPFCFLFAVFPNELLSIVYSRKDDVKIAADLLKLLSPAVVLVAITSITSMYFAAIGKPHVSIFNSMFGCVIKLALVYFMVGGKMNILGAPISSVICYGIIAFIEVFLLYRSLDTKPMFLKLFIFPLISAGIAGVCVKNILLVFVNNIHNIALISIVFAVFSLIYVVLLILFKVLTIKEIKSLIFLKKI